MVCGTDFFDLSWPLSAQVISLTCLGLYRYYPLSFGGNIRDIGYEDRDILGKTTIGGMVVVTLPILVANVFSDGHSLLSVTLPNQCRQRAFSGGLS